MQDLLERVIQSVARGRRSFFRYITANDVGTTGGHQAGFYVPKTASRVLFSTAGERGQNKDRLVRILWQDAIETDSCFVYYGQKTRNEYRITRFGRDFPYLQEEFSGSLLILTECEDDFYKAYILSRDEDIDGFFEHFGISPSNNQCFINNNPVDRLRAEDKFVEFFLQKHDTFPETREMAFWGQKYELLCHALGRRDILDKPDGALLAWIEAEYRLFRFLEEKIYSSRYTQPFANCNELIEFANSILNRRKSRAGKSLEHHLSRVFRVFRLEFDSQVRTEHNHRPDFIFPSETAYHDLAYPSERLVFLGAKTTCKDRWRQILNEAERIPHKYLFTLQKGISIAQLREMQAEGVSLVVPQEYIKTFDKAYQASIYSLKRFITQVLQVQA